MDISILGQLPGAGLRANRPAGAGRRGRRGNSSPAIRCPRCASWPPTWNSTATPWPAPTSSSRTRTSSSRPAAREPSCATTPGMKSAASSPIRPCARCARWSARCAAQDCEDGRDIRPVQRRIAEGEAMNEWIDFVIYAAQAIVLWIYFPRWATRFAIPWMMDRNAAWVAANPRAIERASPGGWFHDACYAWAVITILVLLVFRLGLQPPGLFPRTLQIPVWIVLMSVSNTLLLLGMIGYACGAGVFLRWIRNTVPMSEQRQATLQPRTARRPGSHVVSQSCRDRCRRAPAGLVVRGHCGPLPGAAFLGRLRGDQCHGARRVLGGPLLRTAPAGPDGPASLAQAIAAPRFAWPMQCSCCWWVTAPSRYANWLFEIDAQRFGQLGTTLFVAVSLLFFTWMPGRRHGNNLQSA